MSLLTMYRQSLKTEQGNLSSAQKKAATFTERIANAQRSLRSTKSLSRRQALQREIDGLVDQHARAVKNVGIYLGKVANYAAKVQGAELKEQEKFSRQVDRSLQDQRRIQNSLAGRISATAFAVNDLHGRVASLEVALLEQVRDAVANDPVEREHDIFLSYASPDEETAREFLAELTARNLKVWFAPLKRELGVSVMRQIDKNIANSRVGKVFVTDSFLEGRYWTEIEMGAFFSSRKRVIPVLVDVTHDA